jgi:hypothetical protein
VSFFAIATNCLHDFVAGLALLIVLLCFHDSSLYSAITNETDISAGTTLTAGTISPWVDITLSAVLIQST